MLHRNPRHQGRAGFSSLHGIVYIHPQQKQLIPLGIQPSGKGGVPIHQKLLKFPRIDDLNRITVDHLALPVLRVKPKEIKCPDPGA